MLHDALIFLWGSPSHDDSAYFSQDCCANLDRLDESVYRRILKIAQMHTTILKFISRCSFENSSVVCEDDRKKRFGPYLQALGDGFDEVLEHYRYGLIELERDVLEDPSLPLTYVLGNLEKFTPLFEMLLSVIERVNEDKIYGCQILDLLYRYAKRGDKNVMESLERLLWIQHKIFYEHLCRWLLYGSIDNGDEFIIRLKKIDRNPSASAKTELSSHNDNSTSTELELFTYDNIHADFEINPFMLPSYIPYSLVEKILFIGKSVVLLDSSPKARWKLSSVPISYYDKKNNRFNIWGEKEAIFHERLKTLKKQKFFDVIKLESFIDEVKQCVTEHLWIIVEKETGILHELQVMKDYFLLGRGELFLEFLRLGSNILNASPSLTSTRDINLIFQNAVKAVLLDKNNDIDKISLIIPYKKKDLNHDYSVNISDGWSSIRMKYDVKWPLHLVFTSEILYMYNKIFQFLLRLKKTQHDLHLLWFDHLKVRKDRGFTWQLLNKLIFLLDNIQHYLQSDVLESNFSKLKANSEKLEDFEMLKKIHNIFLIDILSQSFLLPNSTDWKLNTDDSFEQKSLVMINILEILQLCTSFCTDMNNSKSSEESYMVSGYTKRFEELVGALLKSLVDIRTRPCGMHLTRLLMRLDYNRWFSGAAQLTQSVTHML